MDSKEGACICPICMEKYLTEEPRTPCLLPICFHTFCRECLAKCGQQTHPFECPTCREPCEVAVQALKLNFALMQVVEAEMIASGEHKLVCEDCDEDAVNHCSDCNLLLCGACSNHHRHSRLFRTHSLISVNEIKCKRQAAPNGRRFCEKHKNKMLRVYCKSCEVLVCDDCCLIKDHKTHDFNLLEDVADDYRELLKDEARKLDLATSSLKQAIEAIKEQDRILGENRQSTKARIEEYFSGLVEAVRARGDCLVAEVEGVWEEKHKVLEGQWTGLEMAAARMSSGAEHAQKTVRVGDRLEVMETYSGIVKGLRGLRERSLDLFPERTGRLEFAWEASKSADRMLSAIGAHGRVLARDVDGSACVAEGLGLRAAVPGEASTFVVRLFDHKGEECTEGGKGVEVCVRAAVGEALGENGAKKASLFQTSVKERSDGKFEVEYVAEGAGELVLEVLVNGNAIQNSPFTVNRVICRTPRILEMQSAFDTNGVIHLIGTGGGQRVFANPHDSGDVVATMSSVGGNSLDDGDPRKFVQGQHHDGHPNYTDCEAGSWMAVDLKRFRLSPTAYCLRSGSCNLSHKMRNWRLEASEDRAQWTTLREHSNDTSLACASFSTASWVLDRASDKAFRHFRIFQTGKNSSDYDHLMCSGIELYGVLTEHGL